MRKAASKTRHGARKRGKAPRAARKGVGKRPGRATGFGAEGRFETVMKAAERSGLLDEKTGRIAGRVSPTLVEKAKKRTGIDADTHLIAFALANLALEDDFPEAFKRARGKVDPDLKLGF